MTKLIKNIALVITVMLFSAQGLMAASTVQPHATPPSMSTITPSANPVLIRAGNIHAFDANVAYNNFDRDTSAELKITADGSCHFDSASVADTDAGYSQDLGFAFETTHKFKVSLNDDFKLGLMLSSPQSPEGSSEPAATDLRNVDGLDVEYTFTAEKVNAGEGRGNTTTFTDGGEQTLGPGIYEVTANLVVKSETDYVADEGDYGLGFGWSCSSL